MDNKKIGKLITILAILNLAFIPHAVFAEDISTKISDGIMGIVKIVRNIANPVAIAGVVICGLYMQFGPNTQTQSKVKSWLIAILIGLMMINLAEPIVSWMQGLA